mgnify:CR=1 FL=1
MSRLMTRDEDRSFLAWMATEYPALVAVFTDAITARWLREDLEALA